MIIHDLGLKDYVDCWHQMLAFTANRTPDTADQIWLVEHPPVFTQGDDSKSEHLIKTTDIPVVNTDRGGQITYHGPGQLIAYILIDIKRHTLTIKQLVSCLEQATIQCLKRYGINASTRHKAPGVYINHAKIASLGLRIRKGYTYHGLALNVDMDLTPFSFINPCGIQGQEMIQLSTFQPNIEMSTVKDQLVDDLILQIEGQ